jgi:hypothetical protein
MLAQRATFALGVHNLPCAWAIKKGRVKMLLKKAFAKYGSVGQREGSSGYGRNYTYNLRKRQINLRLFKLPESYLKDLFRF